MTNAKALLLAILIVLGVMIPTVCALGYEIVAEPLGGTGIALPGKYTDLTQDYSTEGNAIQRISIDIPTGTILNFTLWYGNGATVSGWMQYTESTDCTDWYPFTNFCQYSGVSINGDDHGYSYRGPREAGRIDIIGYARNWTSETEYTAGFMVYDTLRVDKNEMAYFPTQIGAGVIYKYHITSNKPVAVFVYIDTLENVLKAAKTSLVDVVVEWYTLLKLISAFIIGFLLSLFDWLKFIWENLDLILAGYIMLTLAFAARNCRGNLEKFFRQFFSDQVALVKFLIGLIESLITMIPFLK